MKGEQIPPRLTDRVQGIRKGINHGTVQLCRTGDGAKRVSGGCKIDHLTVVSTLGRKFKTRAT